MAFHPTDFQLIFYALPQMCGTLGQSRWSSKPCLHNESNRMDTTSMLQLMWPPLNPRSDWRNWVALSPIIASMTCRGLLDLLATLLAISLKMRPTSELWTWSARTSARWTWNLSQTSFIEVYTSFATLSSFFTSSLSTIFGFTFASGANNSTLLSSSARDFNLTWARSRSALSWSFSFRMIAMRSVAALSSSAGSIALDAAWTSSVSESICIELQLISVLCIHPDF